MSVHLNILGKKTRHWRKESLGPILVASMQAFKRGKGLLAGNCTCAEVCRIGALERQYFISCCLHPSKFVGNLINVKQGSRECW